MSLLSFFTELKKEQLTLDRLKNVWIKYHRDNVEIIDIFAGVLNKEFKEKEIISNDRLSELYEKFTSKIILNKYPPKEPILEPYNDKYQINKETGLLFQKIKNKYVACAVLVNKTEYKLELSHLLLCIKKGWYFNTDKRKITSAFKIDTA